SCHGYSITPRHPSTKRAIPCEDLDLDSVFIDSGKLVDISLIIVVKMDSPAPLRKFCVGSRPLACCLEISLRGFFSMLVLKVEVDHNVVLGNLYIMNPTRV